MARTILQHVVGTTAKPSSPHACVRRYVDNVDMMQGGFGERTVKQAMRRGNGTLLNIYYASNLNGVTSLANELSHQISLQIQQNIETDLQNIISSVQKSMVRTWEPVHISNPLLTYKLDCYLP